MSSIRARLTMAYALALIGTMLAFALVLLITRRSSAYGEITRHVSSEATLALNIIRLVEQSGVATTEVRDSLAGPILAPGARKLLADISDYVIVLDSTGHTLYVSPAVEALGPDDRALVQTTAITAPTAGVAAIVPLRSDTTGAGSLLLVATAPGLANSSVWRVAVAASIRSANLAVRELVGTMILVLPLLVLASVVIAYSLAGRAFHPVDRIINEVKAISDGRSLHRRLPPEESGDEIGRLTVTLNEMIERLEKSFATMRRFTADASHELKTPLAVLRADVERAMNANTSRSDKLVALEEALHETTRMSDLVNSLLTLARADEGRFDLHRELTALEPLVRETFETAAILAEPAGLTVTMPAIEPATVLGDSTRLRQLFLNIATNAIKYTPRGGGVEIALTAGDGTVAFAVRDTGVGISAADLPHIFERFYRADRARTRSSERTGFGLGLAISQWIAEAHGGTITVRSRLTRGSTFTVTIPTASVVVEKDLSPPAEGASTHPEIAPARA